MKRFLCLITLLSILLTVYALNRKPEACKLTEDLTCDQYATQVKELCLKDGNPSLICNQLWIYGEGQCEGINLVCGKEE